MIRKKSCYYLVPRHNTISACLQCFSAGFISFEGNASCTYKDINSFKGEHRYAVKRVYQYHHYHHISIKILNSNINNNSNKNNNIISTRTVFKQHISNNQKNIIYQNTNTNTYIYIYMYVFMYLSHPIS